MSLPSPPADELGNLLGNDTKPWGDRMLVRRPSTESTDRNTSRKRRRDEISYLRGKVTALEAELAQLVSTSPVAPPPWKRLATQMCDEMHDAIAVNHMYKRVLRDQIRFGQALQTLLASQPEMHIVSTSDQGHWKALHLTTDPHQRRATAAAIAHHQLQQLDHVLVATGLATSTSPRTTSVEPKVWSANGHDVLVVEAVICREFELPAADAADLMWAVSQGALANVALPISLLESFDASLVYANVAYPTRPNLFDRHVLHRIDEPSRHVIVLRSIVQDDYRPQTPDAKHSNSSAWTVIEPLGPTRCCYKWVLRATPPLQTDVPTTEQSREAIDDLLRDWTTIVGQFDAGMQPLLLECTKTVPPRATAFASTA
ncbi:Aste57867_15891 [Aphanomyces stellatus]|uniref:Aste57867_15891 protein n=1 Tax=Aphanomyces stellatus TaxID=120398 RepID=A0A485L623_9STRA|nr:hypothetical protein As57867_015835 [Aphanomyces stellatus]VFT92678.1 Aste57867_15891 [Aphanomyces stellatus]